MCVSAIPIPCPSSSAAAAVGLWGCGQQLRVRFKPGLAKVITRSARGDEQELEPEYLCRGGSEVLGCSSGWMWGWWGGLEEEEGALVCLQRVCSNKGARGLVMCLSQAWGRGTSGCWRWGLIWSWAIQRELG